VTLFVGQAGSLNRQRASQVAGFAAVTIAAVAFIGGWAELPLLSRWGSAATNSEIIMPPLANRRWPISSRSWIKWPERPEPNYVRGAFE
jgi:hypothetical protein